MELALGVGQHDSMSESFYRIASDFCTWAAADDGDPATDIADGLLRLGKLYTAALTLPADPEWGVDLDEPDPTAHPLWDAAEEHFAALPFGFYLMVFDPHVGPSESPVGGDLIDDLGDVFRGRRGREEGVGS